jgi:hypothetical protein
MLGRQGQAKFSRIRSDRSGLRTASPIAGAAIATLLLAACQIPQSGTHRSQADPQLQAMPPSSGVVQSPSVQPAVVQINPTTHTASATIIAAVTQSDAAIGTAAHLTGDPKELVGLDNMAVRRALGDPVWIRKEQPAQVWQYATADCVVDLYLYDENGALKVTFVEARSHKAEAEPTARCLKSLLERPTAQAN